MKFKQGQKVFSLSGYEYIYAHKAPNDEHAVHEIRLIELEQTCSPSGSPYDPEIIEEEGKLILIRDIYHQPPKKKLHDDIEQLNNRKVCIEKTNKKLNGELLKLEKKISSHKAKLEAKIAEFPHHDKIIEFLNSRQPLFWINEYDGFVSSVEDESRVEFNLSDGSLRFRTPWDWSEDSYQVFYCIEEARDWFIKNAKFSYDSMEKFQLDKCEQSHISLGIDVPQKLKNAQVEYFEDQLKKQEESNLSKIDKLKEQLGKLK